MTPKGTLIVIGGHEDKGEVAGENLRMHKRSRFPLHFEILGKLISTIPRNHHIIEIIAAASSIEREMETLYIRSFKQEGFTHVGILKVESKKDARNPESIKRIKSAHAVFFTGGDQQKLISLIANSELLEELKRKYHADKHFIVGGTSAGAMVISQKVITGGLIREALFKGDIKMGEGFGLIQDVIFDTHFIKRGRFARLAHAVALNPECLGIGLGENTALIISENNKATCIGSGMIIIIDGKKIGKTNIQSCDKDTPITIENLKVSILAEGSKYSIIKRK